jgi:2-methylcitrate dehydratase PrpD
MTADMTAQFVADIRSIAGGDVPADVRNAAKSCILDWVGTALAGAHEPLVEMLLAEILTAPSAPCSVVGRLERTSPQSAALINGAAGDALDFSDCNRTMNGHATATVFPCVLALAERTGAPGEAVLRAFLAGVEAACRVGLMLGTGVLETAFHPTAIAGPLGAAAAGAILLRLDGAQFATALGIAATQAAGLADAVGTMCKPLHAGTAAAAGTFAASLAARGFTAPPNALDPGAGFLASHTTRVAADALDASRGAFLLLQTLMKEHAACALTHGSIENMLALKRSAAFAVADVGAIRLEIAASSARICDIVAPRTALEMRFSVRTVAAMALLGFDTGDLTNYNAGIARADAVVALSDRISIDARADLDVAISRATLELRDGRTLTAAWDERNAGGDPERQRTRARAKFSALSAPLLPVADAAGLADRIFALETLQRFDVRP